MEILHFYLIPLQLHEAWSPLRWKSPLYHKLPWTEIWHGKQEHLDQDIAHQGPLGILNENSSLSNDDSLADLGRRAAQNCFLFEKNLKKREDKLEKREENERRKKEERARKEQQARKRGEREASETRQTERRNDREEVSNPTSGGGETLEQMLMSGTSRLEK